MNNFKVDSQINSVSFQQTENLKEKLLEKQTNTVQGRVYSFGFIPSELHNKISQLFTLISKGFESLSSYFSAIPDRFSSLMNRIKTLHQENALIKQIHHVAQSIIQPIKEKASDFLGLLEIKQMQKALSSNAKDIKEIKGSISDENYIRESVCKLKNENGSFDTLKSGFKVPHQFFADLSRSVLDFNQKRLFDVHDPKNSQKQNSKNHDIRDEVCEKLRQSLGDHAFRNCAVILNQSSIASLTIHIQSTIIGDLANQKPIVAEGGTSYYGIEIKNDHVHLTMHSLHEISVFEGEKQHVGYVGAKKEIVLSKKELEQDYSQEADLSKIFSSMQSTAILLL
jgi:hypothetical protein